MVSGNDAQYAALGRAKRLRTVLGVHSPRGFCVAGGSPIAWQRQYAVGPDAGAGIAQPVICLHDAGSGGREFYRLLDRVPVGSQLLLLDWPGHGRSADLPEPTEFSIELCSSRLNTCLDQLGVARPILLCNGFGAAVAIHFASCHPSRVAGLVLCQPAGLVHAADGVDKAARTSGPGHRQALRVELVRLALRRYCDEALTSLRQSEATLRVALISLSCPVLFALCDRSDGYPLRSYLDLLDPLLKSAPQHRLTVFSGDFNPIWDEPERFAQALSAFVQGQLPFSRHHHAWLLAAVDWPTRGMNHWKCVHPECTAEQVLPEERNANDLTAARQN